MVAKPLTIGIAGRIALLGAVLPSLAPAQDDAVAPTVAQMQTLVAQLDEAFGARDLERYLTHFSPDQQQPFDTLSRRLEQLFTAPVPLTRASKLVGEPRIIDNGTTVRAAVLVHSVIRAKQRKGGPSFPTRFLLVARTSAGGDAMATLQTDIPLAETAERRSFQCPACNYEIGRNTKDGPVATDWIVAPMRQDRSRCMESVRFFLPGADVTVELSAHLAERTAPVADVFAALRGDLEGGQGLQGGSLTRPGLVFQEPQPWLPPAHCDPLVGLEGLGFSGLQASARDDDQALTLHVLVRSALRFVLLVRGPADDLEAHDGAIQELLASFRLLRPDYSAAMTVDQARTMHTGGGTFSEQGYANRRYGIAIDLPQEWSQAVRPGPYLFRLSLSCPFGRNRLWVTAYAPAQGCETWSPAMAERMGIQHVRQLGGEAVGSTRWMATTHGFQTARWAAPAPVDAAAKGFAQKNGKGGSSRTVQLCMRDDVLLVFDAIAVDESARRALAECIDSLRDPR